MKSEDNDLPNITADVRALMKNSATSIFATPDFAEHYRFGNAASTRLTVFRTPGGEFMGGYCFNDDKIAHILSRRKISGDFPVASSHVAELFSSGYSIILLTFVRATGLSRVSEFRYSFVRRHFTNWVIELPESLEAYLASLGPSTRKHLPYYLRRLHREHNQIQIHVLNCDSISSEFVNSLAELNRKRMHAKNQQSLWTNELIESRMRLAKSSGIGVGLYLETRLIAGTLSFLHKDEAYSVIITHDPAFDRLNVGNVALLKTIEALIARRVKRFNLLWGDSPYKAQFSAREELFFEWAVCRSRSTWVLYKLWIYWSQAVRGVLTIRTRGLRHIFNKIWHRAQSPCARALCSVRRFFGGHETKWSTR